MEKGLGIRTPVPIIKAAVFFLLSGSALAQTTYVAPASPNSIAIHDVRIPKTAPPFFAAQYRSLLSAPLPALIPAALRNNVPSVLNAYEEYLNLDGWVGYHNASGAVVTANNAFFKPLGSNGRSCFTCHQPASGMSISVNAIQLRWLVTGGRDPIFAPVDGSNCPNNVPASETSGALLGGRRGQGLLSFYESHSLLLRKGLIRVALPVPTQTNHDLSPHPVEFTIAVVSDPYGCNTDPAYAQSIDASGNITQMISVYRRPRMSSNLKAVKTSLATLGIGFPAVDLISGYPLDIETDPVTGQPILDANGNPVPLSGNIMWDGREKTLESQAFDATMGHAQALTPPTPAQVAEMVAFESAVFSAQSRSLRVGDLTDNHPGSVVHGGPKFIDAQPVSFGPLALYDAWQSSTGNGYVAQQKASIARGQAIFNTRSMTISNVAGFNNFPGLSNSAPATCSSCHGANGGNDALPRNQRNIGVAGDAVQFGGPMPVRDLPIFQITCKPGFTTVYGGVTVQTNDPGLALITGKCSDVGRVTVPQLRALSSRPPYFSTGGAATLADVVNFYDKRFTIGLNAQEKTDLVNFLRAL